MQLKHLQFEFSIEKLKSNQAYLDFTSAGTRRKSAFPDIAFPPRSRHVKLCEVFSWIFNKRLLLSLPHVESFY